MYLARRVIDNQLHYILCESYDNGTCLTNRDLINLGPRPDQYIRYTGGSSFHLRDSLLRRLDELGVQAGYSEIERFFLPFLDPYVRDKIAPFQDRQQYRNWKPMSGHDRGRVLEQTHVFDRRRIHYLRFGQVDQRRLDRSVTLYKLLLDKSRDEIEQTIIAQEQDLSPGEYCRYVYTIFDLQRFFRESYARTMPQALDQERLDELFVRELCGLDRDEAFWRGYRRGPGLVPYLIRYLVMYFDYDFPGRRTWDEFARLFGGDGYRARPGTPGRRMSVNQASTVFGVSRGELAAMDKKALTRLYRKKAKEIHPDQGGDHEQFIRLTEAYNELLRGRR